MLVVFGAGNEWDIGIGFGDELANGHWAFEDDIDGQGLGPEGYCPPEAQSC